MNQKRSSGYETFDKIFGGYREHGVTVFAQRPGMGAVTFMMNSAIEIAKTGEHVVFLSREMTKNEFFRRALSSLTNTLVTKLFNTDNMNKEEYEEFTEKVKVAMKTMGRNLVFCTKFDLEEMKKEMQYSQEKFNSSVVFLDNGGHALTEEELEELQSFAQSEKTTIIAQTQLPRTMERREEKRPLLTDISSFHPLKNIVDVYGFYRDEVVNPTTEKQNVLEIACLNQTALPKVELRLDISKQLVKQ